MQFWAELRKKSKSVYLSAPERSRYALSESDIVYHAMTYSFGDNRV